MEKKRLLADKYLQVLSNQCEKFGFFEEKKYLDVFCFKVAHPEKYAAINEFLLSYKRKSRKHIKEVIETLGSALRKIKEFEIKGRYKNPYSIYKKMEKKPYLNIFGLKDLFAFRIIVNNNSTENCFEILNILHDQFHPITDFFKDYITIPKINGYQSLHTGLINVIPDLKLPIEIQIRTKTMDDFAEKGVAAHWVYAKNKKSKLLTGKEKQLIEFINNLSNSEENNVYFCSFEGDLFKLKRGATVLDFAYTLHTDIGNNALFAMINNKKQPLNYVIKDGDKIKIITMPTRQIKKTRLHDANETPRAYARGITASP